MAVTLADDEGDGPDRCLPQQRRQQLQQAFCERFSSALQQEASPSEAEVRIWLGGSWASSGCPAAATAGLTRRTRTWQTSQTAQHQDRSSGSTPVLSRATSSGDGGQANAARRRRTSSRRSERSTAGRMSYQATPACGAQGSSTAMQQGGTGQRAGRKERGGLAHPANTAGTPPLHTSGDTPRSARQTARRGAA